jgi:hypothetical protein
MSDRDHMDDEAPEVRRLAKLMAGKPQSDRDLICELLEHAARRLEQPLPTVH